MALEYRKQPGNDRLTKEEREALRFYCKVRNLDMYEYEFQFKRVGDKIEVIGYR